MRALLQRVTRAQVRTAGQVLGSIGPGLVVLLGCGQGDTRAEAVHLADKIADLRVFEDAHGHPDKSVRDIGGAVLAVPQFTLYADCRRGRRPSFTEALPPQQAEPLYLEFLAALRDRDVTVESGKFRAEMEVELVGAGPFTLVLERTPQKSPLIADARQG